MPRLNGCPAPQSQRLKLITLQGLIQKINTGTLANASTTGFYVYGQSDGVETKFRVYKEDRLYRTGHSWTNNSNSPHFAAAAYNRIVIVNGNGSVYDITPSGGVTGTPDASQNTAYGGGNYGAGEYGVESEGDYSIAEATLWSLDNWGQDLVAVSQTDGFLWELDMAAWSLAQTTEKLTKVSADSAANQVPTIIMVWSLQRSGLFLR